MAANFSAGLAVAGLTPELIWATVKSPMGTVSPRCQPASLAISAVATISCVLFGFAIRPAATTTRSWVKYSPSTLPMVVISSLLTLFGSDLPFDPSGVTNNVGAIATLLTWGRCSSSSVRNSNEAMDWGL